MDSPLRHAMMTHRVVGMMNRHLMSGALTTWVCGAFLTASASAGLHLPGAVPWPGGVVPYEFVGGMTGVQQQAYLDGLREYELAANVHFIARTTEPQWVRFKYVENGPNHYSDGTPRLVEIGQLTRGQICHEMGHAFGLEHEHQRANRDTYITVNYGNIDPQDPLNQVPFNILPAGVEFGGYDFESVMHYGRDVLSYAAGVDTITTNPGYEKYQVRLSNVTLSPTDRAHMASLYGPPPVPLSSVVTTTADGGIGSLRAAIYYAQDHPGTTVTFNIPTSDPGHSGGVFTIKPTGHLPVFTTSGLTIDATTQPGYAGKPVVFVNGSGLITETGEIPAFLFLESNCTVKGLGVQQYPWCGMVMRYPDATGNRISGCSLGVDAAGNGASPNVFQGIMILDGAHGNFVGGTGSDDRNVISGNTQYGIWISGPTTAANTILGNYIGTNVTGTAALPNHKGGVILTDGAHHNTIGGDTAASRNVISGNSDAGIWISGSGVTQNTVRGNYIGLNAAGTGSIANTFAGLNILSGASDNLIAGNVISGNTTEGMRIADAGTSSNRIQGNRIGTSAAGDSAVSNGFTGIALYDGATANRIGGTEPGQGNVISGNGSAGLIFGSLGVQENRAYGNFIGTDATGMAAVPNGFAGVYMSGGSAVNYLGDGPGTGNLISGNGQIGVLVADFGTGLNHIRNNRIGPNAAGGLTLTNQADGIRIQSKSQSTRVGGATPGAPNIISGNWNSGIAMYDDETAGHTFQRNSIHGNGGQGITLNTGTNHNQAAPQLTSAVLTTGTEVSGSLNVSAGVKQFVIEFFASPGARDFIGQETITTNTSGDFAFNLTLPAVVTAGREIIATATYQATGDTSRFSNPVTISSVDGDNDGMPDAYETITPGLNPALASDAALDNDGDGFTNLQEFVAGTNPNDSASRLVTTGAMAGGNFQITLETVAGKFYRIERADTLPGSWETVALHVEGTGSAVQVLVPVSPSAPRQFFRVSAGK